MPADALILRTWVGVASRRTFERHTEILRADQTLLAKARTLWVPIDPATMRVVEVGADVRERFSVPAAQ
jgi:acyl-CoA thioester hydrolase